MTSRLFVLAAAISLAGVEIQTPAQPAVYDVVIRNARVLDGTGNPWLRGDIAVANGRIAAVGRLTGSQAQLAAKVTAKLTIDARDLVVAPGFIDVHSHAATGLARRELHEGRPLLAQGVTTIVANPDGGGPVDLPGQRQALSAGGIGVNVALLIGHGSVRSAVMSNANRAPTSDELDRMRSLVRKGMDDGAFGLSSGLFYTPGSFARTEEVIALAAVAGERGGVYTSHVRDEGNYAAGVVASVDEVIRIAEEGHVIGIVSHMKALGRDSWGLSTTMISHIDAARQRGVQVFADQYPYEASSTSLRAALLPGGVALPTSDQIRQGADLESIAILRQNLARRGGPESIQIASYRPEPGVEGKTLAQIAQMRKVDPEIAAVDLMAKGGVSIVSFNMSEDDIRRIMIQPYTMASSDGGLTLPSEGQPHPRDYGAFARRLGVYVRERNVVDLEFAIRSMTSLPASVFGLTDRGVIRPGAVADLVVFDPARVKDVATYTQPHQLAEGVTCVLVNGVVAMQDGKFTGALAGQVLSKQ